MAVLEHHIIAEGALGQCKGAVDGGPGKIQRALYIGAADDDTIFMQWMVFIAAQDDEAQQFCANEPVLAHGSGPVLAKVADFAARRAGQHVLFGGMQILPSLVEAEIGETSAEGTNALAGLDVWQDWRS